MTFLLSSLAISLLLVAIAMVLLRYRVRTHDLEERNKRLTALRRLDEIMISAPTDLHDVAQKVTDAISFELKLELGVLALVDSQKGVLRRVAMSRTQQGDRAKKSLPFPYEQLEIPLSATENLSIQAMRDNQRKETHNLYDLFRPTLNKQTSDQIQATVNVKTSLVYPIKARGKNIGIMIISLSRDEPKLLAYENESIEELLNVVGIALDNSLLYQDLKATSKQLAYVNERLKELDKLKDDFVSIASHELRTPMTAIRSYVWMALNRPDTPLTPKLKKYLSRTLISTERLINLVNDMLNISRIESGRVEVTPKIFDINSLIHDVAFEVDAKAKERSINLQFSNNQSPTVFADPDKVHQVLLNLIGNSLKFTPSGGIVTVSTFSDGVMVEVSVKDSGVGISRDDISRLFTKFGRLDNSYVATATSGGTGLGLYICKSLVEIMGGKIWVRSDGLNRGSTFTFSLPVARSNVISNSEKYTRKPVEGQAKPLEPTVVN